VRITWQGAEPNAGGSLRLRDIEGANPQEMNRRTQQLAEKLLAWKAGKTEGSAHPGAWEVLGPPAIGEVSCKKPEEIATRRAAVAWMVMGGLAGLAMALLAGLPFAFSTAESGGWYVALTAGAASLLPFLPLWRYRRNSAAESARVTRA
jgi:hypothetical protein